MVQIQNTREIIIRTIETPVCIVSLLENGIIRTSFKSDAIVTVDEMKMVDHAAIELSEGKRFKNIFDSRGGYTSFDPDTRKYAANAPITQQIIVSAFVVNTLPLKLLVNFYLQFNKPAYKIKVFSDYDVALWWLIKYKE
jgi:hypothetical protein